MYQARSFDTRPRNPFTPASPQSHTPSLVLLRDISARLSPSELFPCHPSFPGPQNHFTPSHFITFSCISIISYYFHSSCFLAQATSWCRREKKTIGARVQGGASSSAFAVYTAINFWSLSFVAPSKAYYKVRVPNSRDWFGDRHLCIVSLACII